MSSSDEDSYSETRRTREKKKGARRGFSLRFKMDVLRKLTQVGNTVASVARRHKIKPCYIYQWREVEHEIAAGIKGGYAKKRSVHTGRPAKYATDRPNPNTRLRLLFRFNRPNECPAYGFSDRPPLSTASPNARCTASLIALPFQTPL